MPLKKDLSPWIPARANDILILLILIIILICFVPGCQYTHFRKPGGDYNYNFVDKQNIVLTMEIAVGGELTFGLTSANVHYTRRL